MNRISMIAFGFLLAVGVTVLAAGPLITDDAGLAISNLADTPVLDINMEQRRTTNQLSLEILVVKGTSAQFRVICKGSKVNDSTFATLTTCSSTTPHVCAQREFDFDVDLVAGQTDWMLDVPSNYPFIKCTFDDPGDGTGTVVVDVIRGL